MVNIRLNITLPNHIVEDIKELYGQRGLSQFLADAAKEKLLEIKKQAYQGLIKGYQSTASETIEVLNKFELAHNDETDV